MYHSDFACKRYGRVPVALTKQALLLFGGGKGAGELALVLKRPPAMNGAPVRQAISSCSSSLVAHCSAFAAGKGLLMAWTSQGLAHAAQLALQISMAVDIPRSRVGFLCCIRDRTLSSSLGKASQGVRLSSGVVSWFGSTIALPTEAQAEAWPAIKAGRHVLIAAPTGSGKTLAAFLAAIDGLVQQAVAGSLKDETQIVYVSPLKALSNDIQRNLEAPLAQAVDLIC